jgi:serine protease AprX
MVDKRYPAKYVFLRNDDYQKQAKTTYVGPQRWLYETRSTITQHIYRLLNQVEELISSEAPNKMALIPNNTNIPIPVVVQMSSEKIAKSHRPRYLFSKAGSYQVISIHTLGKLILSGSLAILIKLKEIMLDALTDVPQHRTDWIGTKRVETGFQEFIFKERRPQYFILQQLTSIERISIYSSSEVLSCMDAEDYQHAAEDRKIKVRFFNYKDAKSNDLVLSSFKQKFIESGANELKKLDFVCTQLNTFEIPYYNKEIIQKIAEFPGIELISNYLRYKPHQVSEQKLNEIVDVIYPEQRKTYPKVALVDTGISRNNTYLNPWVTNRDHYIPETRQDNYHGNFIGGLLIYGHLLNRDIQNIVDSGIAILDVAVIPDKSKDYVNEETLLSALESALEKYSNEYNIWSLSFSSKQICSGIISDFTANLDELQKKYNVKCIICTGNYEPLRETWPAENPLEDDSDRISVPADSVRAITVGSLSLENDISSLFPRTNLAAYSRKGPGIGLMVKPDVVHYGGSTSNPILSIDENGQALRDMGTSFSTPLVAAIMSEYFHLFPNNIGRTLSLPLANALLVHGCSNPINEKRINTIYDHFYAGFGLPQRLHNVLYGSEHEITYIFEGSLDYTKSLHWVQIGDFPVPPSFIKNNKFKGEILITLAYEPHLNPRFGTEYCRSNLELRVATLHPETSKYEKLSTGVKSGNAGNSKKEKFQMLKELKWSTAKQYTIDYSGGKTCTDNIILELSPLWRDPTDKSPMPFAVVVTVRDRDKSIPVYREVSSQILNSFTSLDIIVDEIPTRIRT